MTYASRHPASKAKASHTVYVLESRGECDGQGGNEGEGGRDEALRGGKRRKRRRPGVHSLVKQQYARGICVGY